MLYFTDLNNNIYINPIIKNHKNLTSITREEAYELLKTKNTPTAEQLLSQQLAEKRAYLTSTDWIGAKYHDVVTIRSSMSKSDFIEKYQAIYDARDEARDFINANEKANNA